MILVEFDRFDFVRELTDLGFTNAASHILFNYFEGEDEEVFNYRTIHKTFIEYKIKDFIEMYIEEFEEYKFDNEITHPQDKDILYFTEEIGLKPIAIYYIDEDVDNIEKGVLLVKVK